MDCTNPVTSALKRSNVILALILGLLASPESLVAQTAPPPTTGPGGAKATDNPTGWTAKAGLSYVATGGNAEASTLGLKLGANYNWTRTFFTLQGSAVRSGTTFSGRSTRTSGGRSKEGSDGGSGADFGALSSAAADRGVLSRNTPKPR